MKRNDTVLLSNIQLYNILLIYLKYTVFYNIHAHIYDFPSVGEYNNNNNKCILYTIPVVLKVVCEA